MDTEVRLLKIVDRQEELLESQVCSLFAIVGDGGIGEREVGRISFSGWNSEP